MREPARGRTPGHPPRAGGPEGRWSDEQVEQFIGRLLQIGVLVSALVVILGGVVLLAHAGGTHVDYRRFTGPPRGLDTLGGIVRGALALDSQAVVQLGLVLLIATPVARVALTLVAFVRQHDRLYVGLTTVVLGLLVYSLLWGRA